MVRPKTTYNLCIVKEAKLEKSVSHRYKIGNVEKDVLLELMKNFQFNRKNPKFDHLSIQILFHNRLVLLIYLKLFNENKSVLDSEHEKVKTSIKLEYDQCSNKRSPDYCLGITTPKRNKKKCCKKFIKKSAQQ